MSVFDCDYFDSLNIIQIHTSVILYRHWIIGRNK